MFKRAHVLVVVSAVRSMLWFYAFDSGCVAEVADSIDVGSSFVWMSSVASFGSSE